MTVNMISVNLLAIEACLEQADFEYPFNRMANFNKGWSRFPVIPSLFQKFCEMGRPLFPDEGLSYLMENCDPVYRNDKTVIRRGQKLYFDFCRELHTWGLLNQCPVLSSVLYQKALDLSMGVDFLATLLLGLKNKDDVIAIQAMMRGRFPTGWTPESDPYNDLKDKRKERRNGGAKWVGPTFYLTNKNRPYYKSIKRCWLFGPQHVYDLAEDIKSEMKKEESKPVAIQAAFDF